VLTDEFIKASAVLSPPCGYAVAAPRVSIRSKLLKSSKANGSLRRYVLRTPFYERSPQLRCSAVRLLNC